MTDIPHREEFEEVFALTREEAETAAGAISCLEQDGPINDLEGALMTKLATWLGWPQ